MSKYLISIVIPVYGVELYIRDFLDSLFPQINKHVECIFVDDGCIDSSIYILKEYCSGFEFEGNIKIISQSNGGIGSARNTGLKFSNGEFIAFLDPDDLVKDNYIIEILDVIKSNGEEIDIIHINAEVLKINGRKSEIILSQNFGMINADEKYLIKHCRKNCWQPWLRIFNRKLMENFKFPENCIFEDLLSFPELYKVNTRIFEINEKLIVYRLSEGSATGKKDKIFYDSYNLVIKYYAKKNHLEHFKIIYNRSFESLFLIHLKGNDYIKYKKFISENKLHLKNSLKFNTNEEFKIKDRIRYAFPILFYIYKTRFFFKKFK